MLFFFFKFLQCCVGFCHTTVQIRCDYTYIPSSPSLPPLPPSHPSGLSQSAMLGSLCYSQLLTAIRLTPNSAYMLLLLSPFIALSHSPTVSTSPFRIYICISFPSLQVSSSVSLFLDSQNIC